MLTGLVCVAYLLVDLRHPECRGLGDEVGGGVVGDVNVGPTRYQLDL